MKLCICFCLVALLACNKEKTLPSEPWNLINLKTAVNQEYISFPVSTSRWKVTVQFDKEIYDSIFVEVQWDVFAAQGAYLRTVKDTVGIAPQKAGSIHKLADALYQHPWMAEDVKVVYAWSIALNKYEFRY